MRIKSEFFYGNKVSDYGIENGFVDYATLAKAFDAVLSNDIISMTSGIIGEWEQENGWIDNGDEIDEIRNEIESLEEKRETLEEKATDFCSVCTADCTGYCEWERICNKIKSIESEIAEKEEEIERLEEEQDEQREIFQYYIISDSGASILKAHTNEIVFYNAELDMYVWGVDHYGTSWRYVLTDIPLESDI